MIERPNYLEEYEFNDIIDYNDLYNYVNSKLINNKMNYVFIDEVQKITDFQKACDSLYKVTRYDIKDKNYLTTGSKYYLSDIGLRYYSLGSKNADEGHILENVVYLELLRRGYEVYIGKNDDNEVDFVAVNEKGEEYYQVSYTVKYEKTLERELKPLNNINEHNPKFLLTSYFTPYISHNGIKQINVFDWLLGKE